MAGQAVHNIILFRTDIQFKSLVVPLKSCLILEIFLAVIFIVGKLERKSSENFL